MASFAVFLAFLAIGCGSTYASIDASGCGSTKKCIRQPTDNCSLTDPTCLFFSYAWNESANTYDLEMSGGAGNGQQWSGFGFSPNGHMENADIYLCTGIQFLSAVVQGYQTEPKVLNTFPSDQRIVGISDVTVTSESGVSQCTFTREANVEKPISSTMNFSFDLTATNYHLLQARGIYTTKAEYHDYRESTGISDYQFIPMETTSQPSTATTTTTTTTTATSTSSTTITTTPTAVSRGLRDSTTGCELSKGCFRNPATCKPGTPSCMFASWTYKKTSDSFDFQVIGGDESSQYVAVGFAMTPQMQDVDLYYCTADTVYSGVIRQRHSSPVVFRSPTEISNVVTGTVDGILSCSFSRSPGVIKLVSNNVIVNFNLTHSKYYLLFASGQTAADGSLQQHTRTQRATSENALDFTYSAASHPSQNKISMKVQGLFLILSWIACDLRI